MSHPLLGWRGFDNIKTLNPQFDEESFDVLCLPENIETTTKIEDFIDTMESLQLYKIFKSNGVNVLALQDFGIKTPLYERRCDDLYFGTIVIKEIALPIVVTVFSTWISSKLFKATIHLQLRIQKPDEMVSIDYVGDGETFQQMMNSLKHTENEEHKKNS